MLLLQHVGEMLLQRAEVRIHVRVVHAAVLLTIVIVEVAVRALSAVALTLPENQREDLLLRHTVAEVRLRRAVALQAEVQRVVLRLLTHRLPHLHLVAIQLRAVAPVQVAVIPEVVDLLPVRQAVVVPAEAAEDKMMY